MIDRESMKTEVLPKLLLLSVDGGGILTVRFVLFADLTCFLFLAYLTLDSFICLFISLPIYL